MSTRYFSVRRYLLPGVLLVGLLVGLLVASVAFATDIAVTTTNDVIAADSDCSLREAIIAANTNTAANGCMGGSNTVADTITLVNGATYDLTIPNVVLDENVSETGDLDIVNNTAATDLVINVADGGTATINATVPDRVLQILAGATVEIDGVVISGGDLTGSGGGIANISGTGTVTLNAVVVRDNTATSNGGGIYNNGPLIIENGSVIGGLGAGNSAGQGGGIYQNGGTLTLEDSTISHNTSPDGGGVFINTTGTMDVLNSTISANSANYGGGVANFGTLHVQSNSVIGGPGAGNVAAVEAGGLYNEMPTSIMTVDSSTVSYNTGGIGGGISNYRGTLTVTAAKILSNDASGNGDAIWNNYPVMDAVSITGSCIVNNGETALFNNQPGFSQTATGNWWGAADGPGGSGPGHGDTISTGLDTTGFEAAAILGCPFRGVVITETGGSTDVEEGGVTDTYSLVLTAKPTGDVTVSFDTGSQVQSIGPLTFTSLDWATPQAVTVTAVDDAVAEGPHTGAISHSASGGGFTGVSIAGVTAHITDNDTAGVVITETDSSTDVVEGGATDSYDVVLTSEPTGPVTVSVSTDSQVEPIASLTFTSLDWAAPQTVTVTAVDDAVAEGPHTGAIGHTASGGGYDAVSIAGVTVHITDNDTAGVVITETDSSTDVAEGGATDSYDVVLTSEPTGPVIVTFNTGSQVEPIASLTFTTLDWAAPQTVTVTAVDDAVAEGPHTGTISHTASDGGYGAVSVADVTVHIADNDTAGVVITETGGSTDVVEGGATDSYDVVLTSEPTGPVTITVSTDSQVEPIASLTFTTLDWAAPQTVTVTAVDDAVAEDPHTGAIGHTASGGGYDAVSVADVTAHIADNDTAGVVITETGGSTDVVEGGATDSYDVVLTSEPTGPVTITVSTDSQVQPIASLTFTTLDWAAPQTVTVTAVDDAVVEGAHTGAIGHTASGGGYGAVSVAGVTAHIADNDTAGVVITETDSSTDVVEGGATDSYTVVLTSEPTGPVTITVSTDSQVEPIASLTFTTLDWAAPQAVTVTAVDDAVVEGVHTGAIGHTASGGGYDAVSIAGVTAHIADNDTAGVVITETGGSTDVVEGGATDSYDVVLTSEPTGPVTITVSTDSQVQPIASLTFTSLDWAAPQTVTVTAVDDAVVEGAHTGAIGHTASGGGYDAVSIAGVTVHITDNDTAPEPAIAITPSPHDYGSVTVGSSASQTFTVSNTGTANLTLSGIAVSDISGGTFTNAGTGTCTTSSVLAPAVDCTIDATFSPSATGAASGSLDVTSDAASGSGTVALSGTGVAATNLVVNGDMEIDTTPANKLPDGWKISNLEAKDVLDLRAANVHDGLMAMMIKGSGVTKKLFQTIVMTGNAGKNFTFSAWGKATSSVTPGKSTVYVQFLRGTTVKQTVKLNFPAGTYAYTERTKSFTATSRFTSIKVVILYSMTKGAAWFDDIELTSP